MRDRFHEYLNYCETVRPISVGDYIELVGYEPRSTTPAFIKLARDVLDTYNAGHLTKISLPNGGAAFVRKTSTHNETVNK